MWEAQIDDRKLTFRLIGINNQNFLMQDEQTKSWWQQVTGEAILGPLKGRRLRPVEHDELTFDLWRAERPRGRVLRPDDNAGWKEFSDGWEEETARMPVVTRAEPDDVLAPRDVVIGIEMDGAAKAYPLRALEKQSPIVDTLGATPIVLMLGADQKSVRAFEATIDGAPIEFFAKADDAPDAPFALTDARTGSVWDFTGRAIGGPLTGRQLKKIPVLKDYWFDWKLYHPRTQAYVIGAQ